jgi:hypothetical protein
MNNMAAMLLVAALCCGRTASATTVHHVPGDPDGILFANNVIYSEGGGDYPISATRVLVDSNCYFGKGSAVFKGDEHKVIGDPGFDTNALPAHDWDGLAHYRLGRASECAKSVVMPIPNNGGRDILNESNSVESKGAAGLQK